MTEVRTVAEEAIIKVKNLQVEFDTDYKYRLRILNGISFEIYKGETLGLVGESGCGKSMTALSIMQLLETPPAHISGEIEFEGQDLLKLKKDAVRKIRGNRISMIFQEPMTSLNPVYTIGNQLEEDLVLHQGMSRKEARRQAVELLKSVSVALPEKRVKEYPYQLSGGMRQRVMIAMALACRPKLLIADEPTTALDVTIQAQVLDLMRKLKAETGTAIAFITHDLGVVSEMCNRVIVLYCGEIMEEAETSTLFERPLHPYTAGLLDSLPQMGQRDERLHIIPGSVPPAGKYPSGCVFAPRCAYATDRCRAEKPAMAKPEAGHMVRCFRYLPGAEKEG